MMKNCFGPLHFFLRPKVTFLFIMADDYSHLFFFASQLFYLSFLFHFSFFLFSNFPSFSFSLPSTFLPQFFCLLPQILPFLSNSFPFSSLLYSLYSLIPIFILFQHILAYSLHFSPAPFLLLFLHFLPFHSIFVPASPTDDCPSRQPASSFHSPPTDPNQQFFPASPYSFTIFSPLSFGRHWKGRIASMAFSFFFFLPMIFPFPLIHLQKGPLVNHSSLKEKHGIGQSPPGHRAKPLCVSLRAYKQPKAAVLLSQTPFLWGLLHVAVIFIN